MFFSRNHYPTTGIQIVLLVVYFLYCLPENATPFVGTKPMRKYIVEPSAPVATNRQGLLWRVPTVHALPPVHLKLPDMIMPDVSPTEVVAGCWRREDGDTSILIDSWIGTWVIGVVHLGSRMM